ncbi:nitrate reductase molybdenum cofactor assembly chaperone [Hyphomicrobium zavarzinii]|jgi:nitrate reductase delta subunit|uniref:nitrate reductase molybdenum cofactor assembly chaperone n=1 Tax=Hyphomicrobium zavarzinii TaxID=48292 RepID=UPI00037E3023|nr:nitrate reductase molybdenum cofactor assembly chaperone [Hyphomicrobium zavarzinii]HML41498.1 nitrate reductase molybdenum cofactor assembly chaperone [Hyphomicrobium zavarzinii]
MKMTLKTISALLCYPSEDVQAAIPELQAAVASEKALPKEAEDALSRLLKEYATGDIYDLQERYVLLFDRTRSLSLHLFEHVHGESRDRGQAMVDLAQLYEKHGLAVSANELPDFMPLFLEFLSAIPSAEARQHLSETVHILEAIRQRLEKRQSAYASAFSALQALSREQPDKDVLNAILSIPDDDPNDLAALDAAWIDEEVKFGPGADTTCDTEGLAAKIRAGRRPAPGMESPPQRRPVVAHSPSNRA